MSTARRGKSAAAKPPWERNNPKSAPGKAHYHLTAKEKASAKKHAEEAGRPYPNLVDNMRAAAHTDHPAKGRKP